jgi:predicted short-subunit dehydrogenase-like oxidoreductase (DUF2520 family)
MTIPRLGSPSALRVGLIGPGRVGTAVALLLSRAGHRIAWVGSRTRASAKRAATELDCEVITLEADPPPVDLVLLGVPDAAIEPVARSLAARLSPGTVVAHFAGSLGVTPLEPVASSGAIPAALHPVQSCPDTVTAVERLPGSAWGVTCPPELLGWVMLLLDRDLGGEPVEVEEAQRPLWHAAAVVASNGVNALLETGESILRSIGIASPERVLAPLVSGTVANAFEGGGGFATLTGPAVRGEVDTIARHVELLESSAPDVARLYALVTRHVVETAARGGRIDNAARDALLEVVAR